MNQIKYRRRARKVIPQCACGNYISHKRERQGVANCPSCDPAGPLVIEVSVAEETIKRHLAGGYEDLIEDIRSHALGMEKAEAL